jgi:hypothetical protein
VHEVLPNSFPVVGIIEFDRVEVVRKDPAVSRIGFSKTDHGTADTIGRGGVNPGKIDG